MSRDLRTPDAVFGFIRATGLWTTSRKEHFVRCAPEFLLMGQKEPKALRLTLADPALPDRCPVLLVRLGTAPKLAALKQGGLFGLIDLRCSACFRAR